MRSNEPDSSGWGGESAGEDRRAGSDGTDFLFFRDFGGVPAGERPSVAVTGRLGLDGIDFSFFRDFRVRCRSAVRSNEPDSSGCGGELVAVIGGFGSDGTDFSFFWDFEVQVPVSSGIKRTRFFRLWRGIGWGGSMGRVRPGQISCFLEFRGDVPAGERDWFRGSWSSGRT